MNAIEAVLLVAERGGLSIEVTAGYLRTIAREEHHPGIQAAVEFLQAMSADKRAKLTAVALTRAG